MIDDEHLALLLQRAKSGDPQAFDELTRPLRPRLVAFVRSRMSPQLRGKLEPEDVAQDTLLKAYESVHAFRGTDAASLWSWLASLSGHLVLNASRKRSVREASLAVDRAGHETSASRGLRRKERLARLERALAHLEPEQREIIILAKLEGLRARDIAERVGRSEAAVRKAISRGLKELREGFGDTDSLNLPQPEPAEESDDASP